MEFGRPELVDVQSMLPEDGVTVELVRVEGKSLQGTPADGTYEPITYSIETEQQPEGIDADGNPLSPETDASGNPILAIAATLGATSLVLALQAKRQQPPKRGVIASATSYAWREARRGVRIKKAEAKKASHLRRGADISHGRGKSR